MKNQREILRLSQVEQRTGYKKSTIYALVKEDRFPAPVKIGVRAVGWDSVKVDQWVAQKLGVNDEA